MSPGQYPPMSPEEGATIDRGRYPGLMERFSPFMFSKGGLSGRCGWRGPWLAATRCTRPCCSTQRGGVIKELSDHQNKAALGPCRGVIECNAYG
jgi:hypothetical protein